MIDLKQIPVVIMAGGKGLRMRPYSEILPKPLLVYRGKTMVEQVIDNYLNVGFCRFFLILCYKGDLIQTYLESLELPAEIHFVHEQTPLGTAGGLYLIRKSVDTSILVCNCDNLGLFDYQHGFQTHYDSNADITVFVKPQHYMIPFGVIMSDVNQKVFAIEEKPFYDFHASTGIHIIRPEVLDALDGNIVLDMPELLTRTAKNGTVIAENVGSAEWIDMSL